MTDISQTILQQAGVKVSYFSSTSRYYSIATATMVNSKGETVVFVKRRFVPQPDRFFVLQEHIVKDGERLDNITNQYYGDPERFWQICDANNAMQPNELTEQPDATINITLPEGIQGTTSNQ
jgi:nucleoid-associated protein YgaU